MPSLRPRPGFRWEQITWGAPDDPRSEHCSYCGDAIPEESVPLILGTADGWMAQFCDHCQATWWGAQDFDRAEPRPEPEARGR
jgi:hypothetical protein